MMLIEKEHKKSSLMSQKKEELVKHIMWLEHNNNALHSMLDTQAKNFQTPGGWIPVEERLLKDILNPITLDAYVYPVTADLGGVVDIRYYSFCHGHWYNQGPKIMDELVLAWMPLPEPYQPEEKVL